MAAGEAALSSTTKALCRTDDLQTGAQVSTLTKSVSIVIPTPPTTDVSDARSGGRRAHKRRHAETET
ncbi:hypothetical protein E6O75_ATG10282 [Venturia nashicola]|uniref:Uncharacterized protein n=1 Tax=Venturia nashicola TaxID=86259 RepID=A0A4Z1NKN3_9PEZI|nr:hypothetical protein E6O75_ATG10282 [Venturia nashicola]